jgi:hypothetical protein
MKKWTLFLLAGMIAAGGTALAAADEAFAGTWKLDKGKSTMGHMYYDTVPDITLVLAIDGPKLTIRRTVAVGGTESSTQIVLTMDGKECLNDGESLKGLKSTCMLEGGKMRIAGMREAMRVGMRMTDDGGGVPQTDFFAYKIEEEYSLSADGKVMTVVQKLAMPDGDQSLTLVFNRA